MSDAKLIIIVLLIIFGFIIAGIINSLNERETARYEYINSKCRIVADTLKTQYIISPDKKCELFDSKENKFKVLDI
jgi:hypothetical protein